MNRAILVVSIYLLAKPAFGAYVSDLNPNTDCPAVLIQKVSERFSNPALANQVTTTNEIDYKKATSIFDFTVKDTMGVDVPLKDYCKGYVTLIVNVASTCGLADIHYALLTKLNNEYGDKLRILAFPCNQFYDRMQEGDGEEMLCHLKIRNASLGAILAKVNVNGDSAIPLYKYLKEQLPELGPDVTMNYEKFLIDKNGKPIKRFSAIQYPMEILEDIKKLM